MKEIEKAITLLIIITSLLEIFILIRVALYYFHIKDVKTIQKYLPVAKRKL
ncbi:hypothetical protein [Caldanaerobacter subterraneus]|uniref:hypothetical protein n=1 Tax=Caldanaerobacter subterraneus TaxID=911092 RepID=UPI001405519C|nr:hypothetical protein [Caldanaerobacter subterraneus]